MEIELPENLYLSKTDGIAKIKACGLYTAVKTKSKRILISDKKTKSLQPICTNEGKIFEEIYLSQNYLLFIDNEGSLYQYGLDWIQKNNKKYATEILHKSDFIDYFPGEKEIWAINSHRQAFFTQISAEQTVSDNKIKFKYYRDIANVEKMFITEKNKLCIKAIKKPLIYQENDENIKIPELSEICTNFIIENLVFF